ncbi:hypothetical protein R3P38DRAFT_2763975 [Favolaschia claudopus]|uniref:Uncharacterized protein n=1 Tax=Favolaschia claudopus TaxID=2862362 RepID=A0AAW0DII5_9AGAR
MLSLRHSAISLDNVLGPWLLGVVVSSIVFGITSLQIYAYYTRFSSRDPLFLKTFELTRTNESSALCRSPTQRLQLFLQLWFKRLFLRLSERLQPLAFMPTVSGFYPGNYNIDTRLHACPPSSSFFPPVNWLTLSTCKFNPLQFFWHLIEQVDRRTSLEIRRISPSILTSLQSFIISGLSLEIICDLLITGGIVTNLRKSRSKFESGEQYGPTYQFTTDKTPLLKRMGTCSRLNSRRYLQTQLQSAQEMALVGSDQLDTRGTQGTENTGAVAFKKAKERARKRSKCSESSHKGHLKLSRCNLHEL